MNKAPGHVRVIGPQTKFMTFGCIFLRSGAGRCRPCAPLPGRPSIRARNRRSLRRTLLGRRRQGADVATTYETIQTEVRGRVGLITLHRPSALNAINRQMTAELLEAGEAFESDPAIGCLVLTGSDKAFAAGADIKEMQYRGFVEAYADDWLSGWERFAALRKPRIAAVAGFALGGGCELAMMCDIILAADTAKFGQPEIKLGIIPGMGGTQRLTALVGPAKAMDLILTGRIMDAAEAERAGLAARVIPAAGLMAEALRTAEAIASLSLPAVLMAKEAVGRAAESGLAEGLRFERRLFHSLFATADQKEGMAAFVEKRPPRFAHR